MTTSQLYSSIMVAVSARSAKDSASTANVGLVDLRRSQSISGGSHLYEGERLVTGWHKHNLHEMLYAQRGAIEVEVESGHYLLPPQQAAWIPAGVDHETTIKTTVRTIGMLLEPRIVTSPARNDGLRRSVAN
jgi:mannose-6-phosphate isomerase-like protein (cupin superfamily)